MKLTVTPADGEPADTLADLARMIHEAQEQVAASSTPIDEERVQARVRLTIGQKVRSVEVSW